MNTIQNLVFQRKNDNFPETMYIRGSGYVSCQDQIILKKTGFVAFDTYFNSLSLKTWKLDCGIQALFFNITGEGDALIKVMVNTRNKREHVLSINRLSLSKSETTIPIDIQNVSQESIVYAKIYALTDLRIDNINWKVKEEPRREVNIGIVITHYNRNSVVKKTISTLRNSSEVKNNNVSIILVDNSNNLDVESDDFVKVVKNKNLGGAGGFTRGLCYLTDIRDYTHALFMDDDAECSVESIIRTIKILSYFKDDKKCIAGMLLKEECPQLIHERGGIYNVNEFKVPYHGYDMEKASDIVASENGDNNLNYGAWCFFAFPIQEVKYLPMPFFIHGDDVLFSILNKLEITTHLGIFAIVDDFVGKESPTRIYLDTRNYLLITMILNSDIKPHLDRYLNVYKDYLFSNQYDNVRAMRRALADAYNFQWYNDAGEPKVLFNKVSNLTRNVLSPLNINNIKKTVTCKSGKERALARFVRCITLNGMLIPHRNKTAICRLGIDNWRSKYYCKSFIFYHERTGRGYFSKFSRMELMKLSLLGCLDAIYIRKNFYVRKKHLRDELKFLTSRSFWNDLFF